MNKTALTQSITAKLTVLAKEKGVAFANLRTQFLIERLVDRLASSQEIGDKLVYKGGFVSLRVYHSPRFTTDIDAMAKVPLKELIEDIKNIANIDREWDAVWYRFEETVDLKTQGEYPGTRLVFRSGIGEVPKDISKSQIVNLDLSTGDSVFPDVVLKKTEWLIGEGAITWQVYPVESIISEKIHSLISKGSMNSRSKDVFDINFLLDSCKGSDLAGAIEATFTAIGDTPPIDVITELKSIDHTRLRKGWLSATQSIGQLDFDEVMGQLLEKLQLLLKK